MEDPRRLILASASPRRVELLTEMGLRFETMPSEVDESKISADQARTFALRAAYAKAKDVASRVEGSALVIGADTVVAQGLLLFGKPKSRVEAKSMLRQLSGRTHKVITAIAIVESGKKLSLLDADETKVTFRKLDDRDIEAYLETGEPFDKAGAYGIQGLGGMLVESIEGDFHTIVGLPCALLLKMLAQFMDVGRAKVPPVRWSRAAATEPMDKTLG